MGLITKENKVNYFQERPNEKRNHAMSIEIIGAIVIIFGLISVYRGTDYVIIIFIPLTLLASAAAVLLGGSGSIQPAHLMLGFLVLSLLRERKNTLPIMHSLMFPRSGFWLIVLLTYGISGAYLLPRIFHSATGINPIGSSSYEPSLTLVPLSPTSGNITQSIYFIADFCCFMSIIIYTSRPYGFDRVIKSILLYCFINILFALLDLATSISDTSFLLQFIRNADYQIHDDESSGGLRRIIGSFAETSSFSYATFGSLGFTARLFLGGYKPPITGALSIISFALLCFSTSSTAYATLPFLFIILYMGSITRVLYRESNLLTVLFIIFSPLTALMIVLTILINPSAAETARNLIEVTILQKATSLSGIERAQWNQAAIQNFTDTYLLGGGLGSIRASSFILAVASNIGIIGIAGFTGLFINIFFDNSVNKHDERYIFRASARVSCACLIIAGTVSGTLVDLGLPFYIFAAVACTKIYSAKIARTMALSTTARGAPERGRSTRPLRG